MRNDLQHALEAVRAAAEDALAKNATERLTPECLAEALREVQRISVAALADEEEG